MRHYAPYGEPWGEQGTAQTPFGFTGEPTDQNALVQLRARYYNPTLGVFPSLDPVEGDMRQSASLNRYAYAQANPVRYIDPSGLNVATPQCSVNTQARTARCTYNRLMALAYAERYGVPENNSSQQVGLNIGAGTDCANFASQTLVAGGFLLTDNWWYEQNNLGYISKSETWAGVNFFIDFITGSTRAGYGIGRMDINPTPQYHEVIRNFWTGMSRTYGDYQTDSANMAFSLAPGDLVFYIIPGSLRPSGHDYFDHVAVVIGWGCPADGCSVNVAQPPTPPGYQITQSLGLVPWIVDHGLQGPFAATKRPYDQFGSAYDGDIHLGFVKIPDSFTLSNVRLPKNLC